MRRNSDFFRNSLNLYYSKKSMFVREEIVFSLKIFTKSTSKTMSTLDKNSGNSLNLHSTRKSVFFREEIVFSWNV